MLPKLAPHSILIHDTSPIGVRTLINNDTYVDVELDALKGITKEDLRRLNLTVGYLIPKGNLLATRDELLKGYKVKDYSQNRAFCEALTQTLLASRRPAIVNAYILIEVDAWVNETTQTLTFNEVQVVTTDERIKKAVADFTTTNAKKVYSNHSLNFDTLPAPYLFELIALTGGSYTFVDDLCRLNIADDHHQEELRITLLDSDVPEARRNKMQNCQFYHNKLMEALGDGRHRKIFADDLYNQGRYLLSNLENRGFAHIPYDLR